MEGQARWPDAFVSIHVVKLTVIGLSANDMYLGELLLFPPTQAHISSRLSMWHALNALTAPMPAAKEASVATFSAGTPVFTGKIAPDSSTGQVCLYRTQR